jgi:phosphoribosylformylglycinamidine cyclo-ligase
MTQEESNYARSGVDIDAGQTAVDLMKDAVRATYTPDVLSDTGNFGGLFAATALQAMTAPILVASTDGVGTKTKVAAALDRWDSIGQDLVNHCINDILVQGARPLFFLDYVASSKLIPAQIAAIVSGMAQACQHAGCALLGGETAEMPGVYAMGEVDVVGTIVGVVDRAQLLDGSRIQANDVIIGLPSSGLHTNGYSLARAVLADEDWTTHHAQLGMSIGSALLQVHRPYIQQIQALRAADVDIRGLVHITGGGIVDNLPRVLPETVTAIIDRTSWTCPPLFDLIQTIGAIDTAEMYRVFNMGIGMIVIVPPADAERVSAIIDDAGRIGRVVAGTGTVTFEGA